MSKKILSTILSVLLALNMLACGSAEGVITENGVWESAQEQKEAVSDELVGQESITDYAEESATLTPNEGTMEEESIIYEGIDMESDLPGEEWMETFGGIINEPKFVVFSNNVQGRKIIAENGDVVYFNPDEDLLGLYLPDYEGIEIYRRHQEGYGTDTEGWGGSYGVSGYELVDGTFVYVESRIDGYEIRKFIPEEGKTLRREVITYNMRWTHEKDGEEIVEEITLSIDLRDPK